MTAFLTTIIVLFIAVAIWQMVKIFDLAQVGNTNSQVANDKDNTINGYLMIGFLIFIYVITIVCFVKWGDLPLMSNSASAHGPQIDNLMIISMVIIFIVQTITQFLLHYFAYKYKGEKGRKALFYADNNTLEAIWTIIPVIVLAGLIIYGLFTWTSIMNIDEDEDPLVIELYAQQFNWTARYAGDDNVLGMANVRLIDIDKANVLGIDESDPNGHDDVIVKELHLPVGRPVLFKMRSQDVLHSAYMPHFRAQMNCVPGMITQFGFTPTITTEEMRQNPDIIDKVAHINEIRVENSEAVEARGQDLRYEFDYLLLCNKICGKSHYNMQMKIIVETQEEYDAWMKEQKTFKESL
ncbi:MULTISPECIES: cytochrome c oxidase subunit II [Flavobacteriaceae]|jgi:cytochrome c oxidase subunit 2|uniref:Cytochrome c oxidase subunit 2 n=1 Tax=Meridianimaribacter flavus TaxID=571115 RepID=A0ABY2G405_9FLAO|nr:MULTISPECIES: cytochrome c oxidase subunit II [Flavobacteriaceae]RYH73527.1 cytochrome c oxidase subunit II [Flavobacteriaceae bacterium 144Ye]TBV25245.1 cytochrome c oxidase subunit II [Meridianimaribacter sp. CL38]TDY10665.1 cytochrome c oxidase subunit 2 [Meridianimaribacter flavus]